VWVYAEADFSFWSATVAAGTLARLFTRLRSMDPVPRHANSSTLVRRLAAASLPLVIVGACGDPAAPEPPPPPVISEVKVTAPRTIVATGDTLRFVAEARDSARTVIGKARFTWAVVDASLATVDTDGLVRALRPGSIEVRATAVGPEESVRGIVSGSATVAARQVVARVAIEAPDAIITGDTVQLSAVAYDGLDVPMPQVTFTWTSQDTVAARVGTSGVLVARAIGRPTISVRASGPAEAVIDQRSADKPVSVRLVLTQLAGGTEHNCAVARGGVVHCWGNGSQGRLGTGTNHDESTPVSTPVPALVDARFVGVDGDMNHDSRSGHSCALSTTGVVYCWGSGAWGMLADGKFGQGIPSYTNPVPTPVTGIGAARQVSIGAQHSCVLDVNGSVHCAGGNYFAQVGVDPTSGMCDDEACVTRLTAVQGGHTFVAISAGGYHNCGLTAAGEARCWGANWAGQLGTSTQIGSPSATPLRAGTLQFASVSAGSAHTCGLDLEGTAYCWGANYAGQLGNGESRNSGGLETPTRVVTTERFSIIHAGEYHSCALTADGAAYCWGANELGPLGSTSSDVCGEAPHSFTCATKPQPVSTQLRFVSLALGGAHTCGLTATGQAYCWGRNDRGQLGDGTTINRTSPVAVRDLP